MEIEHDTLECVAGMLILIRCIKICLENNRSMATCPTLNRIDVSQILSNLLTVKELLMRAKIPTVNGLVRMSRTFELHDSSGKQRNLIDCVTYAGQFCAALDQINEMLNTPCARWEHPTHPFNTIPGALQKIKQFASALTEIIELNG